ncbi:MAG: MBL fold metallo-hydrolase [Clostridium sp.]
MGENLEILLKNIKSKYDIRIYENIRKELKELLEGDFELTKVAIEKIIELSINLCMVEELKIFIEKLYKEEIMSLDNGYRSVAYYLKYKKILEEKILDSKIKGLLFSIIVYENRDGEAVRQKKILEEILILDSENTLANYLFANGFGNISLKEMKKLLKLGLEIKRKRLNQFKGEFEFLALGGGDEVGGSSYVLKINGYEILVDAGVKINGDSIEYPDFSKIKDRNIEYVFITHAHLDHCGALIDLLKTFEDITIIATNETKELMKFNLLNIEHERKLLISTIVEKVKVVKFNEKFELPNGTIVEFVRAGHILGAMSLFIKADGGNIFFTGDFCIDNQRTVQGLETIKEEVHILITETTYGNTDSYNNVILNENLLKMKIHQYLMKRKSVLIPAFALGRSQEILSMLSTENYRIYIDGGAKIVTKIYENLLNKQYKNKIYFVEDDKRRRKIIEEEIDSYPTCIISSSGMLVDGSASVEYAENMVGKENMAIILTGFQSSKTAGFNLKNQIDIEREERFVDLNKKQYKVECDLDFVSLTSHGDVNDILALELNLRAKDVIFIHGDNRGEEESILEKKMKSLVETNIYIGENNKVLNLDEVEYGK